MIVACVLLGLLAQPSDLTAWRQTDAKGRACYSCHSPDGIELAAYRFDRADLIRRAAVHLPELQQNQIADQILERRKEIGSGRDPLGERPFQPGGSVLSGVTPRDREDALLVEITDKAPRLSGHRIASLKEARQVRDEVLAIDLRSLQIGVQMNRLSEDGFHGDGHASIAHWFPDVPVAKPESLPLQDAYLKAPTAENLEALDDFVARSAPQQTPIEVLALAKYRSLLCLQHHLRTGVYPAVPAGNPFWQAAEIARTGETYSAAQMGLPPDLLAAKTTGPTMPSQLHAMRLPWFWLGWIADPALQKSGGLGETKRADYFTQSLLEEGPYPAHALIMLTRKLLSEPKWRLVEIQYSFLLLNQPLTDLEPKDPKSRKLFRAIAGNAFRTLLFLLDDNLGRSGKTVFKASQSLHVKQIDRYLTAIGEGEPKLIKNIQKKLVAATEIRERSQ